MAGKAYFKAATAPAGAQQELRCFKTVMLAVRPHKDCGGDRAWQCLTSGKKK